MANISILTPPFLFWCEAVHKFACMNSRDFRMDGGDILPMGTLLLSVPYKYLDIEEVQGTQHQSLNQQRQECYILILKSSSLVLRSLFLPLF